MTLGMVVWAVGVGCAAYGVAWAAAAMAHRRSRPARWIWSTALVVVAGVSWLPLVPQARPRAGLRPLAAADPSVVRSVLDSLAALRIPGFATASVAVGVGLLVVGLLLELRHRRRRSRLTRTRVWGYPVLLDEASRPAVIGLVRPRLVLPSRALELTGERRRALVTHELEHIRGGDMRLLAATWLAVAAAPWNPWIWVLARRVALAVEEDCDRRTLRRRRTPPRAYVDLLLEVAGWRVGHAPSVVQLTMGHDARRLLARLDLVLEGHRRVRWVPMLAVLAGVAVAAPTLADPPRVRTGGTIVAREVPAAGTVRPVSDTVTVTGSGGGTYRALEVRERPVPDPSTPTAGRVTATATFTMNRTGGGG